jgi:hypothetical protein
MRTEFVGETVEQETPRDAHARVCRFALKLLVGKLVRASHAWRKSVENLVD